MERFIVEFVTMPATAGVNLKSSMERFIVMMMYRPTTIFNYLKSSMERFIALDRLLKNRKYIFKIQYGEIYS